MNLLLVLLLLLFIIIIVVIFISNSIKALASKWNNKNSNEIFNYLKYNDDNACKNINLFFKKLYKKCFESIENNKQKCK